ncbi:MAG: hypothetical protein HY782_11285 [Chloroflexi bacterium]|nr:hypothetical protein [Chloroflexota bacterium]
MRVGSILTASQKQVTAHDRIASPAVTLDDDLRTALTRLLGSPDGRLRVLNDQGHVCGEITFDDLRAAIRGD